MIRSHIPYDVLVQNALRDVVRHVLTDVAKNGLPGEHHFFITFSTKMHGVGISSRLKERYPEQMTIVLQHQFWDLKIEEDYFTVTLSFGDVAEKLTIPFAAVQAFYDPAAAFEAAFDIAGYAGVKEDGTAETAQMIPLPPRQAGNGEGDGEADRGDESGKIALLNRDLAIKNGISEEKKQPVSTDKGADKGPWHKKEHGAPHVQPDEAKGEDKPSGDVISLDAFRKK